MHLKYFFITVVHHKFIILKRSLGLRLQRKCKKIYFNVYVNKMFFLISLFILFKCIVLQKIVIFNWKIISTMKSKKKTARQRNKIARHRSNKAEQSVVVSVTVFSNICQWNQSNMYFSTILQKNTNRHTIDIIDGSVCCGDLLTSTAINRPTFFSRCLRKLA